MMNLINLKDLALDLIQLTTCLNKLQAPKIKLTKKIKNKVFQIRKNNSCNILLMNILIILAKIIIINN